MFSVGPPFGLQMKNGFLIDEPTVVTVNNPRREENITIPAPLT